MKYKNPDKWLEELKQEADKFEKDNQVLFDYLRWKHPKWSEHWIYSAALDTNAWFNEWKDSWTADRHRQNIRREVEKYKKQCS